MLKKTIVPFFLTFVLVLCMSGCKKTPQDTSSGVKIIYEYDYEYSSDYFSSTTSTGSTDENSSEYSGESSSNNESVTSSMVSSQNSTADDSESPPVEYTDYTITNIETPAEVQADFLNNLASYKIIYAEGGNSILAKKLQESISDQFDFVVPICIDTETEPSEREILIGNTNRLTTSLKDHQFRLSFVDKKPCFEGNNYVAVEAAMNALIETFTDGSSIPTFFGELF